ncbi:MAG: hypothetical protein NTX11_00050 [Candidatus Saccharibacteria bacterium]|nr:hypothetical protein [Candidatus Saccharibacteria bacterium]
MTAENPQSTGYSVEEVVALRQVWPSETYRIGRISLKGSSEPDVEMRPWTPVSSTSGGLQTMRYVRPLHGPLDDDSTIVQILNGQHGTVSSSVGVIAIGEQNLATLEIFTPPTSV